MRGLNKPLARPGIGPTDVLAFSQREAGGGRHPEVLADIATCVPAARRQAQEAGHCRAAKLDRLAVHGLVDLAGYEHEDDPVAARTMRRREDAIIRGWRAVMAGRRLEAVVTWPKQLGRLRRSANAASGLPLVQARTSLKRAQRLVSRRGASRARR